MAVVYEENLGYAIVRVHDDCIIDDPEYRERVMVRCSEIVMRSIKRRAQQKEKEVENHDESENETEESDSLGDP